MIQLNCPSCNGLIEAADTQAGLTVACPHCQTSAVVPPMTQPGQAPPAPSAPAAPPQTAPARKQMTESEG